MNDVERYRPFLFALSYRMTGSAGESEDLVQETYLRFLVEALDEPRGTKDILGAILLRLCLDYLSSERVRGAHYEGLWLPEPALTANEALQPLETDAQRESVSLPFLTLLNALAPEERAAYLLREVYAYSREEIAELLDTDSTSGDRLAERARERIDAQRPPFEYEPDEHRRLAERIVLASHQGDTTALGRLLDRDVTAWTDGGGQVAAALKPVSGRDAVARYLAGLVQRSAAAGEMTYAEVNCAPGLLSLDEEGLRSVLALDVAGGMARGARVMLNPDKLAYVERQLREMR